MSSKESSKRQISLPDLPGDEAHARTLAHVDQPVATVQHILDGIPRFEKVRDYTTFDAEYTYLEEKDLVMHFFLTPEMLSLAKTDEGYPLVERYWLAEFPKALDPVAQKHFDATAPRLQLSYTHEMTSWWFKAQGYGDRLDPDGFVVAFLDLLDSALEQSQIQVGLVSGEDDGLSTHTP